MGNQWPSFFLRKSKGQKEQRCKHIYEINLLVHFLPLRTRTIWLIANGQAAGTTFARGTITAENTIPLEHLGHFVTVTAPNLLSQMTLQTVGKTEQELKII